METQKQCARNVNVIGGLIDWLTDQLIGTQYPNSVFYCHRQHSVKVPEKDCLQLITDILHETLGRSFRISEIELKITLQVAL